MYLYFIAILPQFEEIFFGRNERKDEIIGVRWHNASGEPGGREEQSGDVLIDRVIKNKITIPVILCSSVNLKYPEIYGCVYYSRERNWEADMQKLVNSLVAG